ncbi:RND transporter [Sulfurifustis variabilis]|uniref:RND transporter n=1 Tax=Sulfurifustis variabilis TaxID=1675686 RepID=A0A1B4V803_9GAMM|nr:efflux RND transporter periplasmic adaptor subunit [Sulfurifustis variabilis]BAU49660.1 RND transporter [Sulfurifustis variabilis]
MNRPASIALVLTLVAAGAGAGYWWGAQRPSSDHNTASANETAGRETLKKERRILFYRNPMGLPDTSPVPKKDPMGMDYIPVYEGEEEAPAVEGAVKISVDKVQKLGVRTEPAAERTLARAVRVVGTIEPNERRTYTISPKFEGWIERLYVNATGEPVRAGQPLLDAYSPELVSTQEEYLIALQGAQALAGADPEIRRQAEQVIQGALKRLDYWGISDNELEALRRTGSAKRTLTFRSPVNGVVLEKLALEGMRFMPGEMLYKIADLSTVWLMGEVYEQDLALVRVGSRARIQVTAYPEREFDGRVVFVYPTVNPDTRTGKVRIEVPNPAGRLKPGMYAAVEILSTFGKGKTVSVPDSAVLDSGTRRVVLVQRGEGLFEPREVKTGRRADGYIEVLEGVQSGEQVVVRANFLIDAESNLKAALGAFGHGGHGGGPAAEESAGAASAASPPPGPSDGAAEHRGH